METFAGFIDLGNLSETQEIYSSQLYGTFFGIFASFDCEDKKSNDSYILKKMKLRIINYKGICDLGITNAEIYQIENLPKYILKIEVQAIHGLKSYPLECENLEIPKKNAEILVDRRVKKIHSDESALKNGIFDNEFYYREGLADENENLPFPNRNPVPLIWSEKLPQKELDDFINPEHGIGGSKCPRRRIKVL
jgi:hypothetical protein